jgi:hypothetical protein
MAVSPNRPLEQNATPGVERLSTPTGSKGEEVRSGALCVKLAKSRSVQKAPERSAVTYPERDRVGHRGAPQPTSRWRDSIAEGWPE